MLESIRLRTIPEQHKENFPWTLPLVQNLGEIKFDSPVTFFVGENGSGKSTILEAIAAALRLPVAGSKRMEEDPSMAAAVILGDYLSLKYQKKMHHGLLARAEDFIGFARKVKSEINELDAELQDAIDNFKGGDINLLTGAIRGQKDALINRYGSDLEAMSHGEGFLKLFNARITGRGIYLIDEPEAALSPLRQLSLLSLIKHKTEVQKCQFIIATHSPIIMGMPEADILLFNEDHVQKSSYQETEHYKITKAFLEDPDQFLQHL